MYENWVEHVNWTKRNTISPGEKESRHRPWILFPFRCSSNVLVHWFRLHSCGSSMRPHFGALPKMGTGIFVALYIFVAGVQLLSFPRQSFQPTNFQTQVVPLLPPDAGGRNISVSCGFTPVQKIWNLHFFLSFLIIVVIHPWLAYLQRVLWPDSSEVSRPFCRLCFFFSLSPWKLTSCSVHHLDLPYHVTRSDVFTLKASW